MEQTIDCYWRKAGSCNTPVDKFEKTAFIIASNDPSRIEIINKIKKTLKEFDLDPKVAVELEENNNLSAFCDSICAYIRASCINIVDLTAPLKECVKSECDSLYEEPSVNVYWEYGYAAGLKRPIILICEEKQADSIPFNIIDKQILYYQENNLEEELGRLVKQRLEQPSISALQEEKKKKIISIDIGKTTDFIKTMGKGEMINLIRQSKFQDKLDLTVNILETITQIETWDESKESEGLHTFIILLLRSNLTDEEFIKIFGLVFSKFLKIRDYRMHKINERINEFIGNNVIKKWVIEKNLIDTLIDIFLESDSFDQAGINASIIYIFIDDLNQTQIIKILEVSLNNDQIIHSYNAKPILHALIRIHREKIPMKLWIELIKKKLDERAVSIKDEFENVGIHISPVALKFMTSLEHPWRKIPLITKQIYSNPKFKGTITLKLLKEIKDKDIQSALKSGG